MVAYAAAPEPAGRPVDPANPGWTDVCRAMITEAEAVRLAVDEIRSRPGDPAAVRMAELCAGVLATLGDIGGRCVYDEDAIERIVEREVERRLAGRRGRLRALPR